MYRKWPNKARVVDLILGVQRGMDQMSAPAPNELYWGIGQLTFQKSMYFRMYSCIQYSI